MNWKIWIATISAVAPSYAGSQVKVRGVSNLR
ncbi:hypothetical protein FHY06_002022 [Variovorax sp. BK613]|nr:hypothetical protein [Variovorax sp. BK613]